MLIYNGEIYNYIEIKDALIKQGHRFQTESDTEVVIQALDRWGKDAFNLFEGMWALAFSVDQKIHCYYLEMHLVKSLYIIVAHPKGIFWFRDKHISSLAEMSFHPNLNHLSRFLVNGYKSLYKVNGDFFREY